MLFRRDTCALDSVDDARCGSAKRRIVALATLTIAVAGCSPGSLAPAGSSGSLAPAPQTRLSGEPAASSAKRAPADARLGRAAGLTVLYSFQGAPDGNTPLGAVIVDKGGDIFGTTSLGGASGNGAVFELKRTRDAYAESLAHSFGASDGASPNAAPFEDANGNLFVTAAAGGGSAQNGTIVELSRQKNGYGETGLFSFDQTDGAYPSAGFLELGGTLFTTTAGGGKNGYGNIVAVTGSGLAVTDVYDFGNSPDGASPDSNLVADSSGALYGTTYYGGDGECPQGHLYYHCGTVFKFVPSPSGGTETVIWTFRGGTDGASPYAGVTLDQHGNIYGTTVFGGDPNCGGGGNPDGCGTIFELQRQRNGAYREIILHDFESSPDGRYPYGGLVAKGHELYGTTEFGGSTSGCDIGCGTIFELSKSGKNYAVLQNFQEADGEYPQGGLFSKGAALYGTTAAGGATSNGVVFQFVP